LRVHEKIRANMDSIPVGIPEPLIVGRGIDDVAITVLTLTPKPEAVKRWSANDLTRVLREVRVEIARIENVGLTYLVGEQPEEIRIAPDPERLAKAGLTLQALAAKIEGANRAFPAGTIRSGGQQLALVAGQTLRDLEDIGARRGFRTLAAPRTAASRRPPPSRSRSPSVRARMPSPSPMP
jgi:multidrug efflux pump subunit AcrB